MGISIVVTVERELGAFGADGQRRVRQIRLERVARNRPRQTVPAPQIRLRHVAPNRVVGLILAEEGREAAAMADHRRRHLHEVVVHPLALFKDDERAAVLDPFPERRRLFREVRRAMDVRRDDGRERQRSAPTRR